MLRTVTVQTRTGRHVTMQVDATEYERLSAAGLLIDTPTVTPADKARRVGRGSRGKPRTTTGDAA